MSKLLCETLYALTHESTKPKSNGSLDEFFINKIFPSIASIYPLKSSALLLVDREDRILSIVSRDADLKKCNFENRMFSFAKSSLEKHNFMIRYGKTTLYLLKNIPHMLKKPRYSLLLISENEIPEAFFDLDRISKSLETLALENERQNGSYRILLKYLDAIDDGISACDKDGNVTYINSSACSLLGVDKSKVIGKNLNHPPFKDTILVQILKSKKTQMDFEYNLNYKGKPSHLMNSAYPVFDNDGNIMGAIDIFSRIKRSYQIASNMAGHRAIYEFNDFIGSGLALQNKINLAKEFSNINKNTLLEGESGTGKELFSQSIHNFSDRKSGPFVAINCANYPIDLFDSELFGYDEGAFTGAKKGGKSGKFELADGGTLFLDEIGEMPMQMQAKLLRAIETKQVTRLGSNKTITTDVRIIAATNRDLESMIEKKQFREDLYYRLKILYLKIPPLRERKEDIKELCEHFIEKINPEMEKPVSRLSDEALSLIRAYDWPGNIRQLENILSIAMFMSGGGFLEKSHLIQAGLECTKKTPDETKRLEDSSMDLLLSTLEENGYNIKQTSEVLGISRNTIYRKMKKYGIVRA
ncbi:MAG: sigma 54-interacting transcriptional regulator [Peptostreptococcaceae bacterium]|nr:sigma 54-interacting transcriptional regulator [Peptostreptococcaceae bacterium]